MKDDSMYNDYVVKVMKIAEVKYDLDEYVMEAYLDYIEQCYNNNFSPIKTVEVVAEKIF